MLFIFSYYIGKWSMKFFLISGIQIIFIKLLGKNSNNNLNLKANKCRIKFNCICAWAAKTDAKHKTQKIALYDSKWDVLDYVSMLSKHVSPAFIFIHHMWMQRCKTTLN